jgi:hypothetical protein
MPSQQVSPDLVQARPRDVMHINYPPPHSTSFYANDDAPPPHSTSFYANDNAPPQSMLMMMRHNTPPQKRGSNGPYITTHGFRNQLIRMVAPLRTYKVMECKI